MYDNTNFKTFSIEVKKGCGEALGNCIRQFILNGSESWRPIAYNIDSNSNLLHADANVVESAIPFASALSGLQFEFAGGVVNDTKVIEFEFPKAEDGTTKRVLTSSDLERGELKVYPKDKPLLTLISSEPVKLTLMFYGGSGHRTITDNRELLSLKEYQVSEYTLLHSRHGNAFRCTYNVKSTGLFKEKLTFQVKTYQPDTEGKELQKAIDEAQAYLSALKLEAN